MDDFSLPKIKDEFVVGRYLSPAQIEEVVKEFSVVADFEKQYALINLIHRFVVANGRADQNYMLLYESLCSLSQIFMSSSEDFKIAKPGCIFGYSSLLISLFVMVEIISPDEANDFVGMMSGEEKTSNEA